MRIHAIVDYSYLYYKYLFQLDSGKMKRLTASIQKDGVNIDKDVSQMYYSMDEIEGFRRKLEKAGHSVIVSVCFDMPSNRKETSEEATDSENEAASKYKANRVKRLSEEDFENMRSVEKLLSDAGHNTYRLEGHEADDLIAHLISEHSSKFDYTIIYTPDSDLLVHVGHNVGASRYKVYKGYTSVDLNNVSNYLSTELKCNIPYNALMLFKCTSGDKADEIAGIKGFGPKAFDKLVSYLDAKGVTWNKCGTYENTLELLELCQGYLPEDSIRQAKESLSLVRPMVIEAGTLEEPVKVSSKLLRMESYMKYMMPSLVN